MASIIDFFSPVSVGEIKAYSVGFKIPDNFKAHSSADTSDLGKNDVGLS